LSIFSRQKQFVVINYLRTAGVLIFLRDIDSREEYSEQVQKRFFMCWEPTTVSIPVPGF